MRFKAQDGRTVPMINFVTSRKEKYGFEVKKRYTEEK